MVSGIGGRLLLLRWIRPPQHLSPPPDQPRAAHAHLYPSDYDDQIARFGVFVRA